MWEDTLRQIRIGRSGDPQPVRTYNTSKQRYDIGTNEPDTRPPTLQFISLDE